MAKVIRIIARLNIGGPSIHAILLTSELNASGTHKDILLCGKVSESEGDMAYLAENKKVEPLIIPELGREISLGKDARAFLKLYSIMRKERPEIVHTHTAKAGTLGRLAAILAGVPIKIHTFHGHIFDGYFSPLKAGVFVFIERFLAIFTDRVIVVSEAVKRDITNKLKVTREGKCSVISLGFELDKFLNCGTLRGDFRKRLGISDKTILVGIVGRLVPIKNHKMFLDAAALVVKQNRGIDIKFIIIGDGECKAGIEERVKSAGLEKKVILTGWVKDLESVYADLDIVTLTSLNEGTPVSIIEAMASARAVVSTEVGGVSDLIKDGSNGLLVKSGGVSDLAAKWMMLSASEKMRNELGAAGREFVRERYSKSRLIRDMVDLYRGCLNEKGLGNGGR